MKIIERKEYIHRTIESIELETFKEYVPGNYYGEDVIPLFNGNQTFSILNKLIYFRNSKTEYFAESISTASVYKITAMLDDDDIIGINENGLFFVLTKEEFIQLGKNIDEYDKKYAEYEEARNKANYYQYDYDKGYTLKGTTLKDIHKNNLDKITQKMNSVARYVEDQKAKTEGTDEMKRLASEFDELGVYKKDFFIAYKDEIRIKCNDVLNTDFVFSLHNHLTGMQIARLNRNLSETYTTNQHKNMMGYINKFIQSLDWTIKWKSKQFTHTVVGDKFKVKWNKTKTWTTRTETHNKIINLLNFEDSISLLEFYEDSTRPVGEYYKRIRLDNNDNNILPAEFKRIKGKEYKITIMGDVEVNKHLYLTNNKIKAFDNIRNNDYTFNLNTKELYHNLLTKMDKTEALSKLKTMKAVVNL